jgi:predicted MPP superfamily phosphohydrolase
MLSVLYGLMKGAYNLKVRHIPLSFPALPSAFDGFRLIHISDLHTGSFPSVQPVRDAVQLINQQEADLVCFTGDLVNYQTSEADPFLEALQQIQARYGIYAIRGNHDYGNYKTWPDMEAWQANNAAMVSTYQQLGWHLLRNEWRFIRKGDASIPVIGVDNWSSLKRFTNYGNLATASENLPADTFQLLLSHDPTHWSKEVVHHYPDIDLTLSGHTHGMQMGIDFTRFKASPARMIYKHWAGLYRKAHQYLYVNRGLGFFGFPARFGVYPEITVIELRQGESTWN